MKYILSDKSIDDLFDYEDEDIENDNTNSEELINNNNNSNDEYGNVDDLGTVEDIEEYLYDYDTVLDEEKNEPITDEISKIYDKANSTRRCSIRDEIRL